MTEYRLYTAQQSQEMDRIAMRQVPIAGFELMTRAAEAAVDVLREHWPAAKSIAILAGPGNNGGDGLVMARLLKSAGFKVQVVMPLSPLSHEGDASRALKEWTAYGGICRSLAGIDLEQADVIVDALFGSGLKRAIGGEAATLVAAANRAARPILAVDVPSGLSSDTGAVLGVAIQAEVTATFITNKVGLHTGSGPDHTGVLRVCSLQVPASVYEALEAVATLYRPARFQRLPPRSRAAHKGSHGSLLVIGGGEGMPGAALLAAQAAMRCGAGKVRVACHGATAAMLPLAMPEIMTAAIAEADALLPLLASHDVVAIGPGLGRGRWAQALFALTCGHQGPIVVDADALTLLAERPAYREDWILTPHPGEAATLLQTTPARVQADRLTAAATIVDRYGGVCILKGAGTVVASTQSVPTIIAAGNPGMATAGSGDVLTGVVGGLLSQFGPYRPLANLAADSALIHAMAGDHAASAGERGLLASDLVSSLRAIVNG